MLWLKAEANNLSHHDGLIIIGVDEETDYSICDVANDQNRKKTQDIIAFLREKKFAGGIRPTVYVQPLSLNQTTIDIIVICNDRNTPYFLTEHYQGVFANNIYARIMDTNTPQNASADINVIEKLWKKRFGIDATALERALLYLQETYDWVDSDDGKKFYKYAPEFTLEDIQAEDGRNGYEFYLFNQCDSRPQWYDINIYYYHWDVPYKYFVKGSIENTVHLFYITHDMHEELTARQGFLECVLILYLNLKEQNSIHRRCHNSG